MSILLYVVVALFYSITLVNAANENDCAQSMTFKPFPLYKANKSLVNDDIYNYYSNSYYVNIVLSYSN